jgi:DNA-binding CsgD family transcriptional regulator
MQSEQKKPFDGAKSPAAGAGYLSERAWLDHLSLMAQLPYASWALIPSISSVIRQHIDWDMFGFGWDDSRTYQPLACWTTPINDSAMQTFMAQFDKFFDAMPIRMMVESRGRLLRQIEGLPEFEDSIHYKDFLAPHNVRWGVLGIVHLSPDTLAVLSLFRSATRGRFTDDDQLVVDRIADALAGMDSAQKPLASLDAAACVETRCATLQLHPDGTMLMRSPVSRDILFQARQTGMGPPDWARADWHALPNDVADAAKAMFASHEKYARQELQHVYAWGQFDFLLEKTPLLDGADKKVVTVIIRQHEPIDIIVARRLWGQALSPREKRIIIASTRNPGQVQLASALGITVPTLKTYINQLKHRLGITSRQALITRLLDEERADNKASV